MSLTSGTIALRLFFLHRALPTNDTVLQLNDHRLPAMDYVKDAPVYGWAPGQDILPGREITADSLNHHGHTMATLVRAERKIPTNLLRAECRAAERVRLQADGRAFLSRHDRQEIRESIVARLLPTVTPSLHGATMIHAPNSPLLFTDAVSTAAADCLVIHFRHALGFAPEPVDPQTAARIFAKVDTRDWMPASFSPAMRAEGVDNSPGMDFLTWLWFRSETVGRADTGIGTAALLVEGPLKLVNSTTGGAQCSVLRKGQPVTSREAKSALLAGKKLASATFSFAVDDEVWRATINGEDFTIRGLKLPDAKEDLDPASFFQYRMIKLQAFADLFTGLYHSFCLTRSEASGWGHTVAKMQEWTRTRQEVS